MFDGTTCGAFIRFGGVGVLLVTGLTGASDAPIVITSIALEVEGWGAPLIEVSLRRFFLSGVSSLSLPAFTPGSSLRRSKSRSESSFSLFVFCSVRRTRGYSSSNRTFSSCSVSYSDGSTSATVMDLFNNNSANVKILYSQ